LDCPLKRPPSFEVSLHESLEPTLRGQIATTSKPQAKDSIRIGGKKKKLTPEAKSLDMVVDVTSIPEDVKHQL
jgi:hypothetical protein